ncbi:hypothetical protein AAFC00_006726 [Neodothiora populina]|uniref:Tr-type G domain-containing protein n=1 Tax=Neodothiora populina TaxID=2781224 RepID=A0ABR3PB43_9PEZI
MASIFTYETDIPRVSSPWLRQLAIVDSPGIDTETSALEGETKSSLDVERITRLEAEPQDGPVEYKLHLLLRSRRNFTHMSTVTDVPGTSYPNTKYNGPHSAKSVSELSLNTSAATQQSRQHRLEQLTTQLLWRLQQSSPHHASSSTNVVLPSFPEALPELRAPPRPAKLLHGLEESQGALYEIGVSDDGSFVGLAEDEMRESLNNLRAMAACLGCVVEVQRLVDVGWCSWRDDQSLRDMANITKHKSKLVVAEALIKPYLDRINANTPTKDVHSGPETRKTDQGRTDEQAPTQLRVAFTGPTMSGKSSLLGALSTGTLDNGRGQSRLSMLKHRHEISSGITSSITQELIGYRDETNGDIDIINFASKGISSWIDMHAAATQGRLVFASDSAGHPRYRRTTVRGLVGWSPHWAILCVPADDEGDPSGKVGSTPSTANVLGPTATDIDLAAAHLDLCLRLQLPLVVAITKFDVASRTGLRLTLAKLLSIIKVARRKPILIANPPEPMKQGDPQKVLNEQVQRVQKAIVPLLEDPHLFVPIIMTSAVQGVGLDVLHALLRELPVPSADAAPAAPHRQDSRTGTALFHVEDVYNKTSSAKSMVISGRLQRGSFSIGDKLILGPFSSSLDESEDSDGQQRPVHSKSLLTSRSFPGALKGSDPLSPKDKVSEQEWRSVVITSIRNLRLPVTTLYADQIGTIGLRLTESNDDHLLAYLKIRKGMVLCNGPSSSISTIIARFKRADVGSLAVGSQVVLYIASVRASARILSARTPDPSELPTPEILSSTGDPSNVSPMQDHDNAAADEVTDPFLMVTLHFETAKEYVEINTQVLVMPGGGPGFFSNADRREKGAAGLESFVGIIVEVHG